MPEPTAEELALEIFREEVRIARRLRHMADSAALYGEGLLASEWGNLARLHLYNVSTLARIIRAIRAEKEEAEK